MSLKIHENILLKDFTTFHIGGPARFFTTIKNVQELKEAVSFAKNKSLSFFVLGGGSNILVADEGYAGLVIKNEIKKKEITPEGLATFGAGEDWDEAVKYTIDKNLYGLENLSGIPGTVGATPVQNVGAYGVEVKDTISSVKVFNTETGTEELFTNEQCRFVYRGSIFKNPEFKKYIITEVSFSLKNQAEPNLTYKDLKNYFVQNPTILPALSTVREAVIEIRKAKFPSTQELGLAGSFFKNALVSEDKYWELKVVYPELPGFPNNKGLVKVPVAWVIDHVCNLKGHRAGNVGLYKNQAIVLVNYGGATAEEVKNFSDYVKNLVKEKTGIEVEEEVERI